MFIATIKFDGQAKRVTPKAITKANSNSKKFPKAWYFETVDAALKKAVKQAPQGSVIAISNIEGELLQVVGA